MLAIISNLENNFVVSMANHLVYLSEVLKESLYVTCLLLVYTMMNRFQSAYLNDLMLYSKNEIYFN